jgi:hypothetical protein
MRTRAKPRFLFVVLAIPLLALSGINPQTATRSAPLQAVQAPEPK